MHTCICNKEFENKKSYNAHLPRCKMVQDQREIVLNSINKDEFTDVYVNQGKSVKDMSGIFHISVGDVSKLLARYQIKTRNCKECWTPAKFTKYENSIQEKYGVTNISQSEIIKKKKVESALEKYGVTNVFQSEEIKEKSRATCIEKYGVDYESQTEAGQIKRKQTSFEKYGVLNPSQSEEIKKKIVETIQIRYGVSNIMEIPGMSERIHNTKVERYGENYFYEQMTLRALKTKFTKIHKKIIDRLSIEGIEYEIEKQIDRFFVDIFIPSANLVIEAFGDYWHANPSKYKSTDIIHERTVEEIWDYDKKRKEIIEQSGMKVMIFWETDIHKNFHLIIEKILKEVV